jgi:hypothetical protein
MGNSAIFGLKSTFSLPVPNGCVARRARRRREVRWEEVEGEVQNQGCQIVRACPVSYGEETVEISGRGNPGSVVVASAVMAPGTHTVTRRKISEFNEKEPEFELASETLFSTASPAPPEE